MMSALSDAAAEYPTLEHRRIGELSVASVGLGGNQLGTTCDADTTREILSAAEALGVNFIDTADEYGVPGPDGSWISSSEEMIGAALRGRRDSFVVATKFGSALGEDPERRGTSARWIRQAVDDSLRRLQTDYIDLYQLHFPDDTVPIEETLGALNELIRSGKVREIGCCQMTAAQVEEAQAAAQRMGVRGFASVQHRLNLLRQEKAPLVEFCRDRGIGFIPFFPLASGMLTGKYERGIMPPRGTRIGDVVGGRWDTGEAVPDGPLRENVPAEVGRRILSDAAFDRIEALTEFAAARGRSLIELAFGWLLSDPTVSTVIAGVRAPAQLEANVGASGWRLSAQERATAARLGRGE
jgi:aryl-alcohol dehydrogenase-like predicted oxidoreductase